MNTSENHARVLREQAHLLDLVLDAIILRDLQGAIIFWNQGAEKLFGWTSDEVLGKHGHTLLHTQFPQPWEAIEADVLRAGHWEGELVHTRRDSTPVVVTSRWAVWQPDRGAPQAIVEISTNITERKQVERSQRLLAEAGPVLAASLDATSRLANIAQVVVPLLADWCMVHITEEGQTIQPVAVIHADPQKLAQVNGLLRRDPPNPDVPPGAVHVLRTGRPEFYPEASEELLAAIARDAEQIEIVRSLGIRSAMIVPLVTRGHTLGTITLVVSAESGRQYTEADLALAEELARRAALAVDNARLYAEAQQLNAELEERVAQRTADLEAAIAQLENSRAQLLFLAHHEQTRREEDRARMVTHYLNLAVNEGEKLGFEGGKEAAERLEPEFGNFVKLLSVELIKPEPISAIAASIYINELSRFTGLYDQELNKVQKSCLNTKKDDSHKAFLIYSIGLIALSRSDLKFSIHFHKWNKH